MVRGDGWFWNDSRESDPQIKSNQAAGQSDADNSLCLGSRDGVGVPL
jgi:hypothetical protein